MARLRPDWSARELSDQFLWKEGLNATPEDAWQRMEGPKGLWAMYQNARVMLEMADFAARQQRECRSLLIETLRSDAMQIRVCVLMALTQYGFQRQRRCPHQCLPRRYDVYRHGSPHDPAAAGNRPGHRARLRRRHVTSTTLTQKPPASAGAFPFARHLGVSSGRILRQERVDPPKFLFAQPEFERRRQPLHLLAAPSAHDRRRDRRMVQRPRHRHHARLTPCASRSRAAVPPAEDSGSASAR